MAFNAQHINACGSFNTGEKSALVKTFRETGAGITPTAAPAVLANNTGQVGDNTVALVPAATAASTDTTAALLTSVNAAFLVINTDLSDLTTKLNAMRAALITSGVLT